MKCKEKINLNSQRQPHSTQWLFILVVQQTTQTEDGAGTTKVD